MFKTWLRCWGRSFTWMKGPLSFYTNYFLFSLTTRKLCSKTSFFGLPMKQRACCSPINYWREPFKFRMGTCLFCSSFIFIFPIYPIFYVCLTYLMTQSLNNEGLGRLVFTEYNTKQWRPGEILFGSWEVGMYWVYNRKRTWKRTKLKEDNSFWEFHSPSLAFRPVTCRTIC